MTEKLILSMCEQTLHESGESQCQTKNNEELQQTMRYDDILNTNERNDKASDTLVWT